MAQRTNRSDDTRPTPRADTGIRGDQAESGTVKWFNDAKGYGFIENDAGGPDLFIHFSNIEGDGHRTLHEGDKVAFEIEEGSPGKKPQAVAVRVVEPAAAKRSA